MRTAPSLLLAVWLAMAFGARAQDTADFPGNPPITPRWAFEPWCWDGSTNRTEAAAVAMANGYLSNSLPVGAVIFDDPWTTSFMDFKWDTTAYPDPTNVIQTLRAEGVRVICWTVGMVNSSTLQNPPPLGENPGYPYVESNNLAIDNGAAYTWWKGSGAEIDFSNTNAVNWFVGQNSNLFASGISGLKVDESDVDSSDPVTTSPGSVFGQTSLPRGRFSAFYYAAMFNYARSQSNGECITFARPYTWQFPNGIGSNNGYECPVSRMITSWCGDFPGDFPGFIMQLTNVYASAALGYSSVGFEIGGYEGNPPTHDSLLRQAELASVLPVMENGGGNGGETYHVPWYWDANGYSDTLSTYRYYATLHHNLAPFNFHLSVNSSLTGQPAVSQVNQNPFWHILGNSLLTWAVTTSGTVPMTLNFPGTNLWINWWNPAQTFPGGTQTNLSYDVDTAPLFVRAGAIIPVNVDTSVTGLGDTNSAGKDTVLMFPDGTNRLVYHRALGDGTNYEDATLTVAEGAPGSVQVSSPTPRSWIFRMMTFAEPTNVIGADNWTYHSNVLTVARTGAAFTVLVSPLGGYGPIPANGVEPTPGFESVSVSDDGLVFEGTGGVANASYDVLETTNLALPVAQWRVLETNAFDANGNFAFTNALDPGSPESFYRLLVP